MGTVNCFSVVPVMQLIKNPHRKNESIGCTVKHNCRLENGTAAVLL